MRMEVEGIILGISTNGKRGNDMKLMEVILRDENLDEAMKRVKSNKGVPGVDKMLVDEIDAYFETNRETIKKQILEKKYKPQPVKRVYIPKPNGKKRPLGIPTVVDRVIQQAVAQELSRIYDETFSDNSFGFRPHRSAQNAMMRTLDYLNEGYEWVIDLDIEAYFDTVNHDKLISILRERVFDSATLHLIRKFLQAGIMEKGLERKLFLKVSATKTKVVRPSDSNFLGFTYWKGTTKWECKPNDKSKKRLYEKCRKELIRKKCVAQTNAKTFTRINQLVRGWINYFRIGAMKVFMDKFGQWLRHKIRVILVKQWKKPERIYKNLQKLNKVLPYNFTDEQIFAVANTRLGLYRQTGMRTVNFLLSADVLAIRKGERPGLVNPLAYYLR